MERAVLAGGCFWCVEAAFLGVFGVERVQSGYVGKRESVEILFDPNKITFLQLLDIYWRHVDPFDGGGQFYDRGESYRPAIFYEDALQKRWAEASKGEVERLFGQSVAVEILKVGEFEVAEEKHWQYCRRHPDHFARFSAGHEPRLRELWEGRALSGADLKERLTPLQYHVTQEDGTEPPFENAYWDNHEAGIYVDVITGEPLFSSEDKFESGTGWPSFTKPIDPNLLEERDDYRLGTHRVEVRSKSSGAHLGHVFPDGPTGTRYCMNSAALHFVPKDLS